MAGRFFMRFNLHSSVGHFPVSADIFERLLPYEKSELASELADFERIQNRRVARLRQEYPGEIELIRGKKVLFLGDSITSDNLGYRVSVSRAAELEAYDESISGGTSPMLLHTAKRMTEKARPDLVSLMLGANDSVGIGCEELCQVSIEEYGRNMARMVAWAKQSGAAVLLLAVTPVWEQRFRQSFEREEKYQSNANIERYNAVLRKIADEQGIRLIEHSWLLEDADRESFFEPDGIHLSELGQEKLAESWLIAAAKEITSQNQ